MNYNYGTNNQKINYVSVKELKQTRERLGMIPHIN